MQDYEILYKVESSEIEMDSGAIPSHFYFLLFFIIFHHFLLIIEIFYISVPCWYDWLICVIAVVFYIVCIVVHTL